MKLFSLHKINVSPWLQFTGTLRQSHFIGTSLPVQFIRKSLKSYAFTVAKLRINGEISLFKTYPRLTNGSSLSAFVSVSHYGTHLQRLSPRSSITLPSLDWQAEVTSAPMEGTSSQYKNSTSRR
ncbi:hypothetical protein GOODEAATRI_017196 [Goodea atripinnis]|uniref:Uncharacterized protein n=1 Tax=Goodea atripinnis TaxID=208336 RepID=A0ABV0P4Z3_9TELE